jgi:hypothetical protein
MAKIIKVRCHPNGHINEVDLGRLLREDVVLRGGKKTMGVTIHDHYVLRCQICPEGKVNIPRQIIEENLGQQGDGNVE